MIVFIRRLFFLTLFLIFVLVRSTWIWLSLTWRSVVASLTALKRGSVAVWRSQGAANKTEGSAQ